MDEERFIGLGVWLRKMSEFLVVALVMFCFGYIFHDWKVTNHKVDTQFSEVRTRLNNMQQDIDGVNWRIAEHEATRH